LIGGGSDAMLRIIAKHADMASPMIDMAEAKPKVESYCREMGRDSTTLRWEGGGQLFLNDDPAAQERAVRWAMEEYKLSEEQVREQFFGSIDDMRRSVQAQADAGADEINLFQLPRIHLKSLLRFSEEIIPAFR
jgi:alkanesulfonate monooxygenase SsuD/methylene tetrahydromethanopterin reductase-like flavin-dependent oxidoreductase (luciferase family)